MKSRRPKLFSAKWLKASPLTNVGKLMDATRLIQNVLIDSLAIPIPVRGGIRPRARPQPAARRAAVKPVQPAAAAPTAKDEKAGEDASAAATSRFTASTFSFEGHKYPFRLFIPAMPDMAAADSRQMPLIVLLHGCTQDANDFAMGTAMNVLAAEHGCMVLYPEQTTKGNSHRCWNWFEREHQQLGRGEPGMIAALTQKILDSHKGPHGADPRRVYIAGLSAGGAMAAVVVGLYPELFAALGVHSGLPAGAAQDMVSAFGAMRSGAKGSPAPAMPTIVFHGGKDTTVHPDNGEYISDAALASLRASGLSLVKFHRNVGASQDQAVQKTVYRETNGPSYIEHWRIDGGPHAWSGGDASGSFTDPGGPSASAAMLAFFLQHQKA